MKWRGLWNAISKTRFQEVDKEPRKDLNYSWLQETSKKWKIYANNQSYGPDGDKDLCMWALQLSIQSKKILCPLDHWFVLLGINSIDIMLSLLLRQIKSKTCILQWYHLFLLLFNKKKIIIIFNIYRFHKINNYHLSIKCE